MKFTYYIMALLFLITFGVTGQEPVGPTATGMMDPPVYVPSIADQIRSGIIEYADNTPMLGLPKGRFGNNVVPGKGSQGNDPLMGTQANAPQHRVQPPSLIFVADISQATPSDPTGAAGPNHYVGAWNSAFRIFDKNGNPLTAELSLGTLFPGNTIGDPIVFYDKQADRFVITEFDSSPNGFNVAVCQGSDPVNDGWHVYTTGFGTGSFPDYTKFSVWGDTYMVTANISNANRVFAVERNEMLNGDPAQFVALPLPGLVTSGFYSPQAFHTTDQLLAPAGTPAPIVYLQDDAWGGVADDHLKIWSATIDWVTPGNSTMSAAQIITTADFTSVFDGGSFSNRPQGGGPDIDILQATMMNQVQYRRFGTHNSAVMNFVVDVLAGSPEKAAIRWYELRQVADGLPWTIFQEGTYEAPDGRDAYSGSMVMNGAGDIALGYTSSSATDRISIRYTGRFATDPLNVMTVNEELIAQSTAANPSNRLADYVQCTVDPADDASFWHIAEYFEPSRRDVVAHFSLAPPMPDDSGVVSIDAPNTGTLTATEDITVTVRNFGSNSLSNIPMSYTVNAGPAVNDTFVGPLAAGATASFTFGTQADMSAAGDYTIVASTNLAGDSNPANDSTTKTVTNGIVYCEPMSNCAGFNDGVTMIELADQDIPVNCGATGYSNDTSIVFNFDLGTNPFPGVVQMGFADSAFAIWIDFNDNGTFEANELIADEFVATANTDFNFSVDFSTVSTVTMGMHRMRLRGEDLDQAGDYLDPCDDLAFGRTNDYTANITGTLGVADPTISQSELIVVSNDNSNFDISLVTSFDGKAAIAVYDLLGQMIVFNNLEKSGDRYNYNLNMSYAAAGVYLVKIGDEKTNSFKTAKIIVK